MGLSSSWSTPPRRSLQVPLMLTPTTVRTEHLALTVSLEFPFRLVPSHLVLLTVLVLTVALTVLVFTARFLLLVSLTVLVCCLVVPLMALVTVTVVLSLGSASMDTVPLPRPRPPRPPRRPAARQVNL